MARSVEAVPPSGRGTAKRKRTSRSNAYKLFSATTLKDMDIKFGGGQPLAELISKHCQDEEGGASQHPGNTKLAAVGKMWSFAPKGVKDFFERASARLNAWNDGLALQSEKPSGVAKRTSTAESEGGDDDDDDDDTPIGRTRPSGGGKAHKTRHAAKDIAEDDASSSRASKHHQAPKMPLAGADLSAQAKAGQPKQTKQQARKRTPGEVAVARLQDTKRETSSKTTSKEGTGKGSGAAAAASSTPRPSSSNAKPVSNASVSAAHTAPANLAEAKASTASSVGSGAKHADAKDDSGAAESSRRDQHKQKDPETGRESEAGRGEAESAERKETGTTSRGKTKAPAQAAGTNKHEAGAENTRAGGTADTRKDKQSTINSAGDSERAKGGDSNARSTGKANDKGAVSAARMRAESAGGAADVAGAGTKGTRNGPAVEKGAGVGKVKEEALGSPRSSAQEDGSNAGDTAGRGTHKGQGGVHSKTKDAEAVVGNTSAGKGTGASSAEKSKGDERGTSDVDTRGSVDKGTTADGAAKGKDTSKAVGKGKESAAKSKRAGEAAEAAKPKDASKGSASKPSVGKDSRTRTGGGGTSNGGKKEDAGSKRPTSTGKGLPGASELSLGVDGDESVDEAPCFGLERGPKVPIEVEWPVEVQRTGRKTEERLEWFVATVDLIKQARTDEDGRPKWIISYARHGSLPASKSKVVFLGKDKLMDDFEDQPLRWRRKGCELPPSDLATSPRRSGSVAGSIASSADQEVEWRDDFGLKPRRR